MLPLMPTAPPGDVGNLNLFFSESTGLPVVQVVVLQGTRDT